jgi:hypothetical protein
LLHGVFPSKWKVSNVCPVFKNGDKQNKSNSNYRPIALLSLVSKCLETIVFKRYEFLIEKNLLIENNSGFKRNDSTINLLVSMLHKIYTSLLMKVMTYVLYSWMHQKLSIKCGMKIYFFN